MKARLVLLGYHFRLGLSWAGLAPPLACLGAMVLLTFTAPAAERGHDLALSLETGMPLLAALLAAPLLMQDRERNMLTLIAVRAPLPGLLATRLALLLLYLLACAVLSLSAARLLWGGAWGWEALPCAGASTLAVAGLALLAASWGRSAVHGYLLAIGFWLGALMLTPLLLGHGAWLALTPFAWTFGASAGIILKSKLLYAGLGLLLLGPQWPLLRRPERVLEQG